MYKYCNGNTLSLFSCTYHEIWDKYELAQVTLEFIMKMIFVCIRILAHNKSEQHECKGNRILPKGD